MGDIMVDIMVATMGEADMGTMVIPVVIPVMEDMTMEIMGIMEEIMEVDAVEEVDVVEEVEEMEEVEVAEEVGVAEEEDAVEIDRPKNFV